MNAGMFQTSTSYERVRDRLRADIIGGKMAPGTRLKAAALAKQFGLSLMPIREALQQLQGEGLVIMMPKRGAIVRVPDEDLVSQIFEIRIALEGALTRRAAETATPASLKKLRTTMDSHRRGKNDPELHMKYNTEFHRGITAMTGNIEANKILNQHNHLLFGLRRMVGFGPSRMDQIIADHQALYDAIESGDPDAAERIVKAHVGRARDDLLECMNRKS